VGGLVPVDADVGEVPQVLLGRRLVGERRVAEAGRRHAGQGPAQALGLAAAVIVLVDPLAVLAAGFWLSFGGVAALRLVLAPRAGERAWWRELPRAQLALSLALLPLTAWLFGQGSLVGPFANLLAVPWIGFVVVPLVVAGSLLLGAVPLLGAPLLHLADLALVPLWRLMEAMAALPAAQHHFPAAPAWAFALSVGGIAWLLSPRGVPARPLGLVLLLPLLVPSREVLPAGAFSLLLVDVGQGLSVLVRTRSHVLLFDAGARYPSGFDLGEAAVAPALHALGIGHVDRLVISHGDNDHAGGARSVALDFTPSLAEGGEPGRAAIPLQACHAGEAWHWDGVDFRLLGPPSPPPTQGNDRSCVLQIEGAHASALLPGDISRRQEPAVAAAAASARHPLVLVVPHHGSNGSSSAAFLDTLQPDLALVSTGYRNRFGHPHPAVRERYRERGIPLADTAQAGYLAIEAGADGLRVRRGRDERDAWWREGR
jgi:competence protein ComEC